MRISDKAIVLHSIKHGDKKFILKLYTAHHGLVTAITSVGRTASSKVRAGTIMPLSLLDVELILKQNKEIHQLTEASCYYVSNSISGSFSKLSIAQFLNEVLIRTLKEQTSNPNLFEFIETCLKFLNDAHEEFMNLHLFFLIELTKYLGCEPQNNFSAEEPYFDCREGRFSSFALAFPLGLNKEESGLFSEFLKINSLKTKINNDQRSKLLEILLGYYRLHIPGFNELRSLEVLKEITRS